MLDLDAIRNRRVVEFSDVDDLCDEVGRLRAALQFYADPDNWLHTIDGPAGPDCTFVAPAVHRDKGETALAALFPLNPPSPS